MWRDYFCVEKMERARRKREEERKARKAAREKRIADGLARRQVEDRKSTMVKAGEIFKHGLQRIGLYRKDIEIKGGLALEAVVGPFSHILWIKFGWPDTLPHKKPFKTV